MVNTLYTAPLQFAHHPFPGGHFPPGGGVDLSCATNQGGEGACGRRTEHFDVFVFVSSPYQVTHFWNPRVEREGVARSSEPRYDFLILSKVLELPTLEGQSKLLQELSHVLLRCIIDPL